MKTNPLQPQKSRATEIAAYLKSAEVYLNAGTYERALEEAEKVLAIDPENFYAISFKKILFSILGRGATTEIIMPPQPEPQSQEDKALLARIEQLKRKAEEIKRKGQLGRQEKELQKQDELRQKELEKKQQEEGQRFQELARKQKEEQQRKRDEELRKKEQEQLEIERKKREDEELRKKELEQREAEQQRLEEERLRKEEEEKRRREEQKKKEEEKRLREDERRQQQEAEERRHKEEQAQREKQEQLRGIRTQWQQEEQLRRDKDRKERIVKQLASAASHADQGKFGLALSEITDILIQDPHNVKARELNRRIRDAMERRKKQVTVNKTDEPREEKQDGVKEDKKPVEPSKTGKSKQEPPPEEEEIEPVPAEDIDEEIPAEEVVETKQTEEAPAKKSSTKMMFIALAVIVIGGIIFLVLRNPQAEPETSQAVTPPQVTQQPPATAQPVTVEQLLTQGKQLLVRKEFKQAAEVYRKVISQDPNKAEVHASLGKLELMLGAYDNAVSSLKRAVELNQRDVAATRELALAYQIKGMAADAVRYHEAALQLVSDKTQYLIGPMADAMLSDPASIGRYGSRITSAFEQLLKKKQKDFVSRYRFARVLQAIGKTKEATAQFKKNVEILLDIIPREPNNALASAYLALTMTRQGHFAEAMGFANDAVDIGKQDPGVLYKISQMYSMQMRPPKGTFPDTPKKQLAIENLKSALLLDCRPEELANGDFADLRTQPEFQEAVKILSK